MSHITDAAQALAGLLRAAEEGDLPMPSSAEARGYAPARHPAYDGKDYNQGGISLGLLSLADLTAWAIWLDQPIDDSVRTATDVHHNVYGYAGPIPVVAYALVSLAEVSA